MAVGSTMPGATPRAECSASQSPGLAERKARADRSAQRSKRLTELAELAEAWKAGKTCTEIAVAFDYENQTYVASLIARLRGSHGEQLFPYRRADIQIARGFREQAQSPAQALCEHSGYSLGLLARFSSLASSKDTSS